MSYDISLRNPENLDEVLHLNGKHTMGGGTYCLGGTTEAWINVTYNYSQHFRKVLGDNGIRSIYGMTGEKSIPLLEEAAAKLDTNIDPDYWTPTEGNAREVLINLVTLARLAPHGIWQGD